MTILSLGAGRIAYGLIFDFLKNKSIKKILVIDQNQSALEAMKDHFSNPLLEFHCLKGDDLNGLRPFFEEANGAVSAIPYDYNVELTQLAIDCQTHFVDLGGNNNIVEKQFRLHEKAKSNRVGIIPDCGLAPGMVSIIAAYAMDQLARVDDVQIRVGGLPLSPKTPLKYKLVFSVHGLINEYIEQAIILEDGKVRTVDCMEGLETLEFPSPFGHLEAFYTSGGTSTLPKTYEGKVKNLDYKTIRYPGHCSIMKNMIDLGFTDKKATFNHQGNLLFTRDVFESMLNNVLDYESDDVVLIRVTASGQKDGSFKKITYQAIEYADTKNNLTAMMRTTAFPAAITLQMIIAGKITNYGVLRQEEAIPGFQYMGELEKRGIYFDSVNK